MTLNEEKDEDVVVEEGSQIERGTVTHATVRVITETLRDTRLPREACFGLGDAKVEKDIGARQRDLQ